MDAHVREAMKDCPDEPINAAQEKLEKHAQRRFTKVLVRQQEMIKPASKKMKEKLDQFIRKEKKIKEKSWCQQMSFDSQLRADRFLSPATTRWMAPEKEDRETIRAFCESGACRDVVGFLRPHKGQKVWCVADTIVFRGGFSSDNFKKP